MILPILLGDCDVTYGDELELAATLIKYEGTAVLGNQAVLGFSDMDDIPVVEPEMSSRVSRVIHLIVH